MLFRSGAAELLDILPGLGEAGDGRWRWRGPRRLSQARKEMSGGADCGRHALIPSARGCRAMRRTLQWASICFRKPIAAVTSELGVTAMAPARAEREGEGEQVRWGTSERGQKRRAAPSSTRGSGRGARLRGRG